MAEPKKLRHLSDTEFWKLSTNEKIAYLRTSIEALGSSPKKGQPKKHDQKKRK